MIAITRPRRTAIRASGYMRFAAVIKHDWLLARSVAKYVGFHDTRWLGVKRLWKDLADEDKQEWWDEDANGSGTGLVKV